MTNLFEWQRAMRSATLPGSLKLLLWTISSYAGMDGRDARPPVLRLCSDVGLSRQRLFELLRDAQESGWISRATRPGRPTEYVLSIPFRSCVDSGVEVVDPSDGSDGSGPGSASGESDNPSDVPDWSEPPYPSDGSDGSTPYPSDRSDEGSQTGLTRPTQDHPTGGHAGPQAPRRPTPPQAPGSTGPTASGSTSQPTTDSPGQGDPPPARASPPPGSPAARQPAGVST